MPDKQPLSGHCYCGAVRITAPQEPLNVAICHCVDCRRVSGAPLNAFASFMHADVDFSPKLNAGFSITPGVPRWFCTACGRPLAATYDYLPAQIYVPVGLFDQVDNLTPQSQSHTGSCVNWIPFDNSVPQDTGSGRGRLLQA